ncbi:MAG: ribose 5-phosphate isomerase B [Elusimicrobia bacterium]|nr:ribose 5-phosphate isomerase B [Elusimicrobiota bacterium]
MNIAIASDHAGFILKSQILEIVKKLGHTAIDLGTDSSDKSVDYPDFAKKVALEILSGKAQRGIIICGSGVGASIAANKFKGIRAGLCHDTYSAHQAVEHDDMNTLCMGARVIGIALAEEIIKAFLGAKFSNEEHHKRRLAKVNDFESNQI